MFIKICGTTNLEDALLSYELGSDALGFIFYEKSPRYISFDEAKKIIEHLAETVEKVGVFVDYPIEKINHITQSIGLTMVQLNGNESPEDVHQISSPVLKSFRVSESFDFSLLENYDNCTFLLDTFSKDKLGGIGETFDWSIIPNHLKEKVILAGGITSHNIGKVFSEIKPKGVDLVSSVEKYPGKKDEAKLKEFFRMLNKLKESSSFENKIGSKD